jgi:hypothetical protein
LFPLIKQLISERDMYVTDKAKYQGQLTDQKRFMNENDYANKSKRLKALIEGLEETIWWLLHEKKTVN